MVGCGASPLQPALDQAVAVATAHCTSMVQPLVGISILDFSTLLPGPLTTLLLAEAGARVIKIERPGRGDEMRSYEPKFGASSVNFALLNRGKESLELDLKSPDAMQRLRPLIAGADVLVEQFRPGVMDRLGFGYRALSELNPRLIYCSISGWGQAGPKSATAGHDLNFVAESGILALAKAADGSPTLPTVLSADIAGGAYPAVMNILLALEQRRATGVGMHLDVAMYDNLFTLAYWAWGNGFAADAWPRDSGELLTGDSPRYQIYRTADNEYIAAAPLEEKFWVNFCELIGLEQWLRGQDAPQQEVVAEVRRIIRLRTAAHWGELLESRDTCCSVVRDFREAVARLARTRGFLLQARVKSGEREIPALPVPIAAAFRGGEVQGYPALGSGNRMECAVGPPAREPETPR